MLWCIKGVQESVFYLILASNGIYPKCPTQNPNFDEYLDEVA